jgi:hypothetical protein
MGYTVDLQSDWLWCRSEEDARKAQAVINEDKSFRYSLQVETERDGEHWYLRIDHFQGDHWHEDEARAIWLAIAPHMADDASIEFQGEDLQRWRIRWLGGRCFEDRVEEVVWIQDNEIGAPKREESRT